jgi:hypothetical protein
MQEPILDQALQLRVRDELTGLRPQRSTPSLPIRSGRPVRTKAAVASHLTADRGGRPTQPTGDLAQRAAVDQAARDLLSFGQGQHQMRSSPRGWLDATRGHQVGEYRGRVLTEHPTDRLQTFTPAPPVPDLSALGGGIETSLRSSSHDTSPLTNKVKRCADRLRSPSDSAC